MIRRVVAWLSQPVGLRPAEQRYAQELAAQRAVFEAELIVDTAARAVQP